MFASQVSALERATILFAYSKHFYLLYAKKSNTFTNCKKKFSRFPKHLNNFLSSRNRPYLCGKSFAFFAKIFRTFSSSAKCSLCEIWKCLCHVKSARAYSNSGYGFAWLICVCNNFEQSAVTTTVATAQTGAVNIYEKMTESDPNSILIDSYSAKCHSKHNE